MTTAVAQPMLVMVAALIVQATAGWLIARGLAIADKQGRAFPPLLYQGIAWIVLSGIVSAAMALPIERLLLQRSAAAALLVSAVTLGLLLLLWRLWPLLALPLIGDADADNPRRWLQRSIDLTRDPDRFFSHGLPASLAQLLGVVSVLLVAWRPELLPFTNADAAIPVVLLVGLPLLQLIVITRVGSLIDSVARAQRQRERHAGLFVDSSRRLPQGLRKAELDACLLSALRGGDAMLALEALDRGADPNATPSGDSRDQRNALAIAVTLTDLRPLRALIAAGAHLNSDNHLGALLAATRDSYEGRPESVLMLLANGADARQRDGDGNTALHHAARCAEPVVTAQLLDAGADIDAVNADGMTPLGIACSNANAAIVDYLLERGASSEIDGAEPALHLAAALADDNPAILKRLIKRKASIDARGRDGATALLVATRAGNARIATALLDAGACADQCDEQGNSVLMEAARGSDVDIIHKLIRRKASVDRVDADGRSALAIACLSTSASEDCVRALLAAKADRNLIDHGGRRAVDHAAAAGRWHIVALLDAGYPLPSNVTNAVDSDDATNAAHLVDALRFGHWRIANAFAPMVRDWPSHALPGALLALEAADHIAARDWLFNHGLDTQVPLSDGRWLVDAVIDALPASTTLLGRLIEAGAAMNGTGIVARIVARAPRGEAGEPLRTLARVLAERGADCFGPAAGQSVIHLAVESRDDKLLALLLERGVDPNQRDSLGRTPLHRLVEPGHVDPLPLLKRLLLAGARPDIAAGNGETALGIALARGHRDFVHWLSWSRWPLPRRPLRPDDLPAAAAAGDASAVERLLELGLTVDARDGQGATALIRASGTGDLRAIAVLLDAGADAGCAAASGATCLSAAISARREAAVALLLARGVAADHPLPGGATALHVAAAFGLPRIADLLLEAGGAADRRDDAGTTPLHAAAQFAFSTHDTDAAAALFGHLLRHGAKPDERDSGQHDSLMLLLGVRATPGSHCDPRSLAALTTILLDHGAALDHQDERGVSALHACAMHGLAAAARQLKARGAPLDLCDGFGRTPGDVAGRMGFNELAAELGANRHAIPGVNQMLRKRASD